MPLMELKLDSLGFPDVGHVVTWLARCTILITWSFPDQDESADPFNLKTTALILYHCLSHVISITWGSSSLEGGREGEGLTPLKDMEVSSIVYLVILYMSITSMLSLLPIHGANISERSVSTPDWNISHNFQLSFGQSVGRNLKNSEGLVGFRRRWIFILSFASQERKTFNRYPVYWEISVSPGRDLA